MKPFTDQNIRFFISEKDKGIYDAMNKGIEMPMANGFIFWEVMIIL